MGPLFRRVGETLRREGYGVFKVNFNGGDRLFWRLPNGIDYRGTMEDWPRALAGLIDRHAITDVILFGDCRPMHMAAIPVCRDLHVPVHVFEEGYIRPGWVTLEPGGVNGHSTLPRDPEWYRAEAAALPPAPEHRLAPASFRRRALEGLAYNAADVLSRWHYPHWENHRPWHPLVEGMGWTRRLLRRKAAAARSDALIARLADADAPYMLFPLQLDSDVQIRLHSPFAGIADALRLVIASFAKHAPASLRLVVKEHPLDNGVRDWRLETAELAARFGVADRVDYLESGDIAPVTERASGVVTINSTSGTFALIQGIPVIALGQAVYDIEGVTYQGELDSFWSDPGLPDVETFAAFCRVLIDRCLVAGSFFSEEGLAMVTDGVVARLKQASPIRPAAERLGESAASRPILPRDRNRPAPSAR
ncbi:capsular biosynthesis protein [Nostoc sp. 3335mG]|nr:capsular biosynthesis protein [Nostoc sp. 3335mG]